VCPIAEGRAPTGTISKRCYTLLEGELEFTFRGEKSVVKAGMTVNIPANAPHFFTNIEGKRAHLLCMCTPAGQEDFFMAIGSPVDSARANAQQGTAGGLHEEGRVARAPVPNRVVTAMRRFPLRTSGTSIGSTSERGLA
jgi:Cupin domain